MERMKKQAQLGQWKTPPNQVYAAPPSSSSSATVESGTSSLGTKMQLMGLGGQQQKRPVAPPQPFPVPLPMVSPSSYQPVAFPSSQPFAAAPISIQGGDSRLAMMATSLFPQTNGAGTTSFSSTGRFPEGAATTTSPGQGVKSSGTKSLLLAPSASPIAPSPFEMVRADERSPPSAKPKQPVKRPVVKKSSSSLDQGSGEEAVSPVAQAAASSTGVGAPATPEEKERMLAHSRTMARLRRQQQRVMTDSLEAEFFELCISAAYLKAALTHSPCNVPLERTTLDRICQEANERSLEAIDKSIPTARSQELKSQVSSGKPTMPQAHVLPALQVDDATATHLAVTVGSRRESFSFSTQRRKEALTWAASGVKRLYDDLAKDAIPFLAVANCAMGSPDASQDLANRLNLTPEQCEVIRRMVPGARADMANLVCSQRAADMVLTDHWLSLPKTDTLMEHVKDTTTTEQMNKLISWSITNEAQIATLKLGTVKESSA